MSAAYDLPENPTHPCLSCEKPVSTHAEPVCGPCSLELAAFCEGCGLVLRLDDPGSWPEKSDADADVVDGTGRDLRADHIPCKCPPGPQGVVPTIVVFSVGVEALPWEP